MSWYLWEFRCDENCGVGGYDKWQYTGQAVLAVTGAVLGFLALALGFTHRRRACYTCLALAAVCAYAWVMWVLVIGGF